MCLERIPGERRLRYAAGVPLVGQQLLQFQLLAELGRGGMGVVYRALDANLNRQVALKLLPEDVAHDPGRRARFFREARAAAAVTHPNIATIYQVDQVGSQIFIAMELVDGDSLEAWLTGTPLPVNQALAMMRDVCAGVGCAHRAGIVHRDLKPANIMIAANGPLKVLDFGIAKLPGAEFVPPRAGSTQPLAVPGTQAGQILGTAGYMSPEQTLGAPVDARSDVFSIGVMLYEMLAGQRPFRGDTAVAVMVATAKEEPVPVSRLNPRAAGALEQLLAACLAKDPQRRPAHAAELEREIDRLLGGHTPRMHAGVPRMHADVVLGATQPSAGSTFELPGNSHGAPGTDAAVAGTIPRVSGAGKSLGRWVLGLGTAALVTLAVAGGGAAAWHWGWFAVDLREPAVGLQILKSYENPDDSRSSALDAPAWATATRDFEEAAAQRGAPRAWSACADFTQGQELLSLGRLEDALLAFKRSQAKDPQFALPWLGLSATLLRQKKTEEALAAAQKAQQLAPKSWPAVAAAARAYAHDGKFDFAIQEYRRALGMAPDKPYLLSELALMYHAARMDDDAKRYAEKALALDPELVPALVLLAERALEAEDGQTALKHARRATAVEPRDVTAWLAQGDAQLLLKEPGPARQALQTAVRLWRETRQRGAPEERLKQVQAALDRGELPDPRTGPIAPAAGADGSRSTVSSEATGPVARSVPAPRSVPRAKPGAGAGAQKEPPRSLPAPAPQAPSRSAPELTDL
jgi:serine/threonine-protein kinase